MSVVQKPGAVDAAVGDAAGPDQHAVARSAAEITSCAHGAVVLPFWAPELQTQPKARSKVGGAEVTDEGHLIGAAEQDLHAHVEADLTVRETAAAAPALALRVGTTPLCLESRRPTKKQRPIRTDPKIPNKTSQGTHLVTGRLLPLRF